MEGTYNHTLHSVHALVHLLYIAGKKSRVDTKKIQDYLQEFKKNDFSHLQEFKATLNTLLEELEKIKTTGEQIAIKEIKRLEDMILLCSQQQILNITASESKQVKEKIQELFSYVNTYLRDQIRDQKRLQKEKQPHSSFWLKLHSAKGLTKKELKDAKKLEDIDEKEQEEATRLKRALAYVGQKRGKLTHQEFHHLTDIMKEYFSYLLAQFELLHDIETEDEVEEVTLLRTILNCKDIQNEELSTILEDFHKKFAYVQQRDSVVVRKQRKRISPILKRILPVAASIFISLGIPGAAQEATQIRGGYMPFTQQQISILQDAGYDSERIERYNGHYPFAKLLKVVYTPEQRQILLDKGARKEQLSYLQRDGVPFETARGYAEAGAEFFYMTDYYKKGITPETMNPWKQLGFYYTDIMQFIEQGWSFEEVKSFEKICKQDKKVSEDKGYFHYKHLVSWATTQDFPSFKAFVSFYEQVQKKLGISYLYRFHKADLEILLKGSNYQQRALIILPGEDHNNVFSSEPAKNNFSQIIRNYNTTIREVSTDTEMIEAIRNIGEEEGQISFLVIAGHGNKENVNFGKEMTHVFNVPENKLLDLSDIDQLISANLQKYLSSNCVIWSKSCLTGEGGAIEGNIASMIHRIFGRRTIASRTSFSPNDVTLTFEGRRITQIIIKDEKNTVVFPPPK